MKLLFDRNREEVEDLIGKTILEENKDREIITDINKPINMLIEGDNLLSLNHLLETHRSLINLIYIDPPYRTQNKHFKYNDYFKTHDEWLSFMDKRLRLAKELLTDDGVIFISIDDNELYNLKLLCDEVFGENNFIGNIIWKKKHTNGRGTTLLIPQSEYILTYAKDIDKVKSFNRKYTEEELSKFKYEDEISKYYLATLEHSSPKGSYVRKNLQYKLIVDGKDIYCSTGQWLWEEKRAIKEYKEGNLVIKKDTSNNLRAFKKIRLKEKTIPGTIIDDTSMTTTVATKMLNLMFGGTCDFNFSKPVELIKYLISMKSDDNLIVLDFFAGSGTTGHAVLELNKEDGGNRQFILCTNNENNICEEVTYPRLEKVINGYITPKGKEVEGLGGNLKYYKVVENNTK